jgi:lipopolysaccharide/colanic/teichoic acid biosynthesis glycosyltransferase
MKYEPRQQATGHPAADVVRRLVDLICAILLLALLLIPMLLIGALVWAEDGGPAFFRQERVGLNRRRFTMLKFRTMSLGAGDGGLPDLIARELRGENTVVNGSAKLADDKRVTRTGAILRRTSLDELPQLINVLTGSMSLVGPRPCLEWEAEMFPAAFEPRFAVRPGITGLWQVSGRSTLGTLEMLQLDAQYACTRTLLLDASILVRTLPVVLRQDGAR